MKEFSKNAEKRRSTVAKKASDSKTPVKKAKIRKSKRLRCARILVETQH